MNVLKKLDNIASKIGIRNAHVEERRNITGGLIMEWAIIGDGYITEYDINFLKQQDFEITGFFALSKNEIMIIVKETA